MKKEEFTHKVLKEYRMGKYFGTDGFRGEANVDLTVMHAYKVGRYLGYYYGKNHKAKVVIGKDTRRSSYMFEYSLVAGLTASGADVYLLHVTPTPSVSYVVRSENFDCGIMISASHNPYYDNGIKVINGNGYKLEAEVEALIEEYIDKEEDDIPFATGENIGRTVDYSVGRHRYIGYLMSLATRSFKDVKVGLDLSNGSATTVAKGVFDALGARTYVINHEPDGVNINKDCGSTYIDTLQKYVVDNGLDVGFAYDGDADRCLAVDDKGNIIDGDLILYLCGTYLKERGELNNNTVVTTVMSNIGLYKAFDKKGISYEKTTVGDKYVNENMVANNHSLGGEQSGHIIFSKHATTGDGVLTSLKLMEVMLEKKQKLSELIKDVKIYPQLLVNVKVYDKPTAKNDKDVIAAIERITNELGNEGRILVRESGTEQLLRVMVEAQTDEKCKKYVYEVIDILKDKGYVKE
jgi:phosphoglucosamine mutase